MDSQDSFQEAAQILSELQIQVQKYKTFLEQTEALRNSTEVLNGNIGQINDIYQKFSDNQKDIANRFSEENEKFSATLLNLRQMNAELENILAADHVDLSNKLDTIRKDSFNHLLKDLRNDFDDHMKRLLKNTYTDFANEIAKFKNDTVHITTSYAGLIEQQVNFIVKTYNSFLGKIDEVAEQHEKKQVKFQKIFIIIEFGLVVILLLLLMIFKIDISFIRR